MKVAKDLVVSLAYQVRTEDGVLVDESPVSAPLDYLHGHGSLISGLEKALEDHEAGDKFEVNIAANDAYGQYDDNLVQRVPKDVFMGVDELQVVVILTVRVICGDINFKLITSLMVFQCLFQA
jgi:FKBP-type peptidyl-prolyl cis-trans isomerase SlyD